MLQCSRFLFSAGREGAHESAPVPHPSITEQAEIEAMKKQMASPDVWDSEGLSIVFKVGPGASRRRNMTLGNSPHCGVAIRKPLGHAASNPGIPHFFQVVVVAGIIGVTTILAFLAQPVINNIVNAFPHAS